MADFRKYSDKIPFRQRSENPEIATELSLQCWRAFGVDGVIMFSDILTILPALGVDLDVVKKKVPQIEDTPRRPAASPSSRPTPRSSILPRNCRLWPKL